jgi:hypothetical protein
LELFEQALLIMREVDDQRGEATTLSNIAILLYSDFSRPQDAIQMLEQAIFIMHKLNSPYKETGNTLSNMVNALGKMKSGQLLKDENQESTGLLSQHSLIIAANTVAVLTAAPEKCSDWRQTIAGGLTMAQASNKQDEIEFFTTLLSLLDGKPFDLPEGNTYTAIYQSILDGLT